MALNKKKHVENTKNVQSNKADFKQKKTKFKRPDVGYNRSRQSNSGSKMSVGYIALIFIMAAICGICHRNHIAGMHERDRHFSHLSSLERELSFRTEMGLYYSYYKTMIEAPTALNGLQQIMYDNVTEYPLIINTLKRFNLYQEVTLGVAFRTFEQVTRYFEIRTKDCWQVNRGQGLSPVWSCEGIGDPAYFYIEMVFLLNGLHMSVMFLFGTFLSGSVAGGLLTVLSIFYNHGEGTRVQWTPPLRESVAYPVFVMEMFLLSYIIRIPRPTVKHSLLLAVAIVCFMLPWQFAQFALMTQTLSVAAIYFLGYIGTRKVKIILLGQALGLAGSYVLLFGNEMLVTSLFASAILTLFVLVLLEPLIELVRVRAIIWGIQGVSLLAGTIGLKILIGKLLKVKDDAHIGDILRSKFTDYSNFHTSLYTCAVEFDFMETKTPLRVTKTLLLPSALLSLSVVIFHLVRKEYYNYIFSSSPRGRGDAEGSGEESSSGGEGVREQNNNRNSYSVDRSLRSKAHAEVLYHVFQMAAFTFMAVIIMRLKLFWTPHLCLMTCFLASRKFFSWVGNENRHLMYLGALIGLMSIGGYMNLQHQWSITGEYSNLPMEKMVEWINMHTRPNAVFAGAMPTMATIKLCTKRPIVNHPHYEDEGLRERTEKIYSMFSRKPVEEVWRTFREMQVDYVISELNWCMGRSKPGCGMVDIFDREDPENRNRPQVCKELKKNPAPYFKKVYSNENSEIYQVLRNPDVNKDNKPT